MEKKGASSDLDHGMVVGGRQAGLIISKTANLKKRKYPVNSTPLGEIERQQ